MARDNKYYKDDLLAIVKVTDRYVTVKKNDIKKNYSYKEFVSMIYPYIVLMYKQKVEIRKLAEFDLVKKRKLKLLKNKFLSIEKGMDLFIEKVEDKVLFENFKAINIEGEDLVKKIVANYKHVKIFLGNKKFR